MSQYAKSTVAQLKEILTQRGLPLDGLKQDLIVRLEENDKTNSNAATEQVANTPVIEPVETPVAAAVAPAVGQAAPVSEIIETTTTTISVDNTKEPVGEIATTETIVETVTPKPELTKEEITKLALEHLGKKVHRAKKFGLEQTEIDELERSIARIEKFGVDLQSPLAVELGLVKKPIHRNQNNNNKNNMKKKKNKNNNKGRVNKGNNNNRNRQYNGERRPRY
ncbi:similar to Saccharomyces cerevisiae YER063W THO1 Conserved nuclear RNA-binding protein [Maudiozyma saulgeensis]|uniref:Similar to Saccharomyces cerevisiae YER063W THO1 Conserved nuclear RNA-binding protein n=1 Tax=Maudiozyma saulgeensis TaxID=1789683 RepID=A0A1X7R3X2_9SACH|nr:similar to Saccharomyces cerevisiae YER063W THO1 Conserved nuclear RNA-binding protein [Kazachstania saulgeensis]